MSVTKLRRVQPLLCNLEQAFSRYYQQRHPHRELSCHWDDTCVVLQTRFPKQPAWEFHVNAVQVGGWVSVQVGGWVMSVQVGGWMMSVQVGGWATTVNVWVGG